MELRVDLTTVYHTTLAVLVVKFWKIGMCLAQPCSHLSQMGQLSVQTASILLHSVICVIDVITDLALFQAPDKLEAKLSTTQVRTQYLLDSTGHFFPSLSPPPPPVLKDKGSM